LVTVASRASHKTGASKVKRQRSKVTAKVQGPKSKLCGSHTSFRVQVDVCKIAAGLYHYAAIDDCTRYRVMGLYPRRTGPQTIAFLERVIEEMPFAIQRIQTDRGREFFALRVQQWLRDHAIQFRPIRPASPHLNGKIERAHQTDLLEFYATVDLTATDLHDPLASWQHTYNWHRPHSSLNDTTRAYT
jgi:transposase InsO family protein